MGGIYSDGSKGGLFLLHCAMRLSVKFFDLHLENGTVSFPGVVLKVQGEHKNDALYKYKYVVLTHYLFEKKVLGHHHCFEL